MRVVLVKVGACVFERKNLMVSPFTSPLKTLLGWEEAKWRYWKAARGEANMLKILPNILFHSAHKLSLLFL